MGWPIWEPHRMYVPPFFNRLLDRLWTSLAGRTAAVLAVGGAVLCCVVVVSNLLSFSTKYSAARVFSAETTWRAAVSRRRPQGRSRFWRRHPHQYNDWLFAGNQQGDRLLFVDDLSRHPRRILWSRKWLTPSKLVGKYVRRR